MGKNPLAVAELFGLDAIEGIERRREDDALVYLFKLDGLLPEGQRLAVDVSRSAMGVCPAGSEQTLVAETHLSQMEICLVTALVLSHPCAVEAYQVRALYQLHKGIEGKRKRGRAVQEAGDEGVREVLTTCNLKLKALGVASTRQPTSSQGRGGCMGYGSGQLQAPSSATLLT